MFLKHLSLLETIFSVNGLLSAPFCGITTSSQLLNVQPLLSQYLNLGLQMASRIAEKAQSVLLLNLPWLYHWCTTTTSSTAAIADLWLSICIRIKQQQRRRRRLAVWLFHEITSRIIVNIKLKVSHESNFLKGGSDDTFSRWGAFIMSCTSDLWAVLIPKHAPIFFENPQLKHFYGSLWSHQSGLDTYHRFQGCVTLAKCKNDQRCFQPNGLKTPSKEKASFSSQAALLLWSWQRQITAKQS